MQTFYVQLSKIQAINHSGPLLPCSWENRIKAQVAGTIILYAYIVSVSMRADRVLSGNKRCYNRT